MPKEKEKNLKYYARLRIILNFVHSKQKRDIYLLHRCHVTVIRVFNNRYSGYLIQSFKSSNSIKKRKYKERKKERKCIIFSWTTVNIMIALFRFNYILTEGQIKTCKTWYTVNCYEQWNDSDQRILTRSCMSTSSSSNIALLLDLFSLFSLTTVEFYHNNCYFHVFRKSSNMICHWRRMSQIVTFTSIVDVHCKEACDKSCL